MAIKGIDIYNGTGLKHYTKYADGRLHECRQKINELQEVHK